MNGTRSQQVKRVTRQHMLACRCAQDAAGRVRGSGLIRRRIAALPEFRLARTVAFYLATPDEVDVDALVARARASGKRTAVPAWRADRRAYGFREVTTVHGLRPGHYGLREPVAGDWLPGAAFDLILVPGTAFDRRGRRIGMGAGWYDRLLGQARGAVCVGVGFDFQMLPALPYAAHDRPMHVVVTESATWRCRGAQGRRSWGAMPSQAPRGMGVPPMRHGQDARATLARALNDDNAKPRQQRGTRQ